MDTHENDYHISFFKPTTEIARLNRNIVILLVSIWAVAVFGFQIALRILEKPVPEESYIMWEKVWDRIASGNASDQDLQTFAYASLSVLGKNFIGAEHRAALDDGLSWALFQLADPEQRSQLLEKTSAFEQLVARTENITDPDYIRAKKDLASMAGPILGLAPNDVRNTLIARELVSANPESMSAKSIALIPSTMSTYLIHNQSALTDARILGFPFHYFYTAIFLLVLFVGLCWLYCKRTDRKNALLGIED